MKRTREALEGSQRGVLPYASQVEIINGLTRARATEFDLARRAAQEGFYDRSLNGCRQVNPATLLCAGNDEGTVSADWARKICRAVVSGEAHAMESGPLQVETVQLVANENTCVIFAPPAGSLSASPLAVAVPKGVGERVYPGDVVLLRTATQPAPTAQEATASTTPSDASVPATSAAAPLRATHVEFLAFNGLYFSDLDEWREAVMRNATCVTQWLALLNSHAPGIAQLTQLHAASLGDDPDRPAMSGWARSLQLPILLQVNKTLQPLLDAKATEKLRRLILSTLRFYVNLFTRTPSLVSTEYWYHNLFCEFMASPLCVVGFSMTWPSSAGTMISSAWDAVVRSLADLLDFALYQVCVRGTQFMHQQTAPQTQSDGAATTAAPATTTVNNAYSAAQTEAPLFLQKRAVGAMALILHRITGVALQHVQAYQLLHDHHVAQHGPGSDVPLSASAPTSAARANESVYRALEGMGHTGLLYRVAQWLQLAESTQSTSTTGGGGGGAGVGGGSGGAGGGGGLHALLDRVCAPPSQQDVEELFALKSETTWEQMQVMQRTYTPYLSHDATRFVEAMALAAYAELYGPSARAAQILFDTQTASTRAEVVTALRDRGVCGARVGVLAQPALRPSLLLTEALTTIRHMAAYGLPVHLTLHDDDDVPFSPVSPRSGAATAAASTPTTTTVASLRSLLASTAFQSHGSEAARDGSLAVLIGVRLQGRPVLFPAVLTRLTTTETTRSPGTPHDDADAAATRRTVATVYVLRDGDLLPDFLDTSASLAEGEDWGGEADAWLVASSRADMTVPGDSATAWADTHNGGNSDRSNRPHHGGPPHRRQHARQEPPVLAEPHRLLPRGTAALSYQDLLERLTRLRGELQRVVSGSSSASSSTSTTATAEAWRRVSGLWLHYFASRHAPSQQYVKSLSGSATATLSGGSGKQELTRVLQEAAARASFTPLQVTVLHTMCEVNMTAPNRSNEGGGGVLSSIKVLEGSRGSGKSSVLYASGMVRGEVHRLARKEHQDSILSIIKKTTATVKTTLAQAEGAASFADLYGGDGGMSDLPEEIATSAIHQMSEYVRLNEGLHYCTVPLLVRPYFTSAVPSGMPPPAIHQQLFPASSAALQTGNITSIDAVVQEALVRCRKAPLTQLLVARLAALQRLGDLCSQLSADEQRTMADEEEDVEGGPSPRLSMQLLPLVMSAREIAETVKAATEMKPDASDYEKTSSGMTWASYVTQHLWPDVPVMTTTTSGDGAGDSLAAPSEWTAPLTARQAFAPVVMPVTMHLTRLALESRRGWSGLYQEAQRDLLPLLRTHVQEVTKHVCRLFYDLVITTAAISQTSKYSLLTTSNFELSQGLHLPFLWGWAPLTVLVDDIEAVSDSFLSVLPPANHLTVALCSTSPAYTARHRQLPMMLLKEIEHAAVLTTAVLRERLRCNKAELQETLKQLCGNGSVPFTEYALNAKRRRERAAAKADAIANAAMEDDGDEDDDAVGPVSAMGRGVTTVSDANGKDADAASRPSVEEATELRDLSFRGVVSASALEVWTHAVPTVLGEAADHAAALFLQRYLASYGVNSSQIITAFPDSSLSLSAAHPLSISPRSTAATTAVYFPFVGTADNAYLEECDVAIVCVTALAMRAVSMAQRRRVRRGDRGRPWADVHRAKDGLFAQRLQHWLWHAVACARVGVMVIGSRELFLHVPLLRGLEAFAMHHRCNVPLMATQKYWLPEAAESGSLALRCPAHDKCRRTATVRVDATEHDLEVLLMEKPDPGTTAATTTEETNGRVGEEKLEGDDEEDDEEEQAARLAAAEAAAAAERLAPCVDVRGAPQCLSMCLQPFDACDRRSHACLLPCHTQRERISEMEGVHIASGSTSSHTTTAFGDQQPEEKGREQETAEGEPLQAHAHCPFPCCKPLQCGHLCSKTCGDVCEPCTFTGLRELSCGQRVVSGVNNNQEITYEVFHHFQEAPCGSAPALCVTPVSVPCPRCGVKMSVPCHEVTASLSRARVAAGERGKAATPEPPQPDFSLPETECVGCVTLYNKIAQEFGYPALPLPPVERVSHRPTATKVTADGANAASDEEALSDRDLEDLVESVALPRDTLSNEAQAKLRSEFAKAAQKLRLRTKAEALNISCGRTTDEIDYVRYKKTYTENKARLAEQEQVHRDAVNARVAGWAQRLRKDIAAQVQLNAELETMLPLLVSEAEREAARQESFPY